MAHNYVAVPLVSANLSDSRNWGSGIWGKTDKSGKNRKKDLKAIEGGMEYVNELASEGWKLISCTATHAIMEAPSYTRYLTQRDIS